jgi:hypothetical protein
MFKILVVLVTTLASLILLNFVMKDKGRNGLHRVK